MGLAARAPPPRRQRADQVSARIAGAIIAARRAPPPPPSRPGAHASCWPTAAFARCYPTSSGCSPPPNWQPSPPSATKRAPTRAGESECGARAKTCTSSTLARVREAAPRRALQRHTRRPRAQHSSGTLAELARHFPCERGCTIELGADTPAYVVNASTTLHSYCLVSQRTAMLCSGRSQSTRRLCACVPAAAATTPPTTMGGGGAGREGGEVLDAG